MEPNPARVHHVNFVSDLLSNGDPAASAILAGSDEVTYQQLGDDVDRMARLLLSRDVAKQDRVAIWAENGVFFVVSYLAVIRAGLIAVPLQTDSSWETALKMLRDAGVGTVLASRRYQAKLGTLPAEAGIAVLSYADLAPERAGEEGPLADAEPGGDVASLMFTSGSTGRPKGVMVTHRNIACNTRDIVACLGLTSSDRGLVVLPFYYCFGLSLLHTLLSVGGSLVINNQFMYPERVLQDLNDRQCTGLAGVPSTFQILLRKSRFARSSFPSLRWLQQAGGRLPNPYLRELIDAFPTVRLHVMYGQTEGTARLSCLPPEQLRDKLGSIGTGLPSTRLEVVAPNGGRVRPGSEEIGEIVASGDNVSPGYWNDPEETARYFRGGRLHTGDMARVDADGFIFIVEREREIVKSGGHRVSIKEIEDVIAELQEVVEVAVVSAPHELLGEAIVAFVECITGTGQPKDILEHCRRRLPPSKVPESVVHLAGLPHTSSGKVHRSSLKELAASIAMDSGGPGVVGRHSDLMRPLMVERRREV
jgi:long-chain acyl-CoA synthetase